MSFQLRDLNENDLPEVTNLISDVSLGTSNTIYTTRGDWLGWISLALFVGFIIFQTVTARNAQKAGNAEK